MTDLGRAHHWKRANPSTQTTDASTIPMRKTKIQKPGSRHGVTEAESRSGLGRGWFGAVHVPPCHPHASGPLLPVVRSGTGLSYFGYLASNQFSLAS